MITFAGRILKEGGYFTNRERNCWNLIVTFDEERIIQANGIEIHIVPAWRWLLE